jgi:hypothetical protein
LVVSMQNAPDNNATVAVPVKLLHLYTSTKPSKAWANKQEVKAVTQNPVDVHQGDLGRAQTQCLLTCYALESMFAVRVEMCVAVCVSGKSAAKLQSGETGRAQHRPVSENDFHTHIVPWPAHRQAYVNGDLGVRVKKAIVHAATAGPVSGPSNSTNAGPQCACGRCTGCQLAGSGGSTSSTCACCWCAGVTVAVLRNTLGKVKSMQQG